MEQVLQLIQQYGFPIACCIFLFIMLQNEQKNHREEAEKLNVTIGELKISFNEAIHDQQKTVTEAINNNTLVIQQLLDTLRKAE